MPRKLPTADALIRSPLLGRLHELGGAAAHGRFVRDDAERNELRNLVRCGLVVRTARATYALPGASVPIRIAARFGGHIDCVSAAELAGLPVLNTPTTVHLALPHGRGTSRRPTADLAGATLHRTGSLAWADLGAPVQPLAAALARMLVCRPRDEALVAVDGALHADRTTIAAIRAALPSNAPRCCRTSLGLADGRADSLLETLVRLALVDAGYEPRLQVWHEGVGLVDFQVEHVIIECDGFEYHSGREEYRRDRQRDRTLHSRGMIVLRFTYEEIVGDPTCVVRALEAVLVASRP